jgi:hypothetical protein
MQGHPPTVNETNFHCSRNFETAYYRANHSNEFVLCARSSSGIIASQSKFQDQNTLMDRDLALR